MSEPFQLSALDFCVVPRGLQPVDGLWQALDLAPALESFGYSRYWIAEHHSPKVIQSSPEILLPILAGVTNRMHIGTAGILLSYYSPFKVASCFRFLNMVFPGRIDLGLGRGRAHGGVESLLLENRQDRRPYEDKVKELLTFLRGHGEEAVPPLNIAPPEVWVLGSTATSMPLAAANGTAFCLSLFLNQVVDPHDVIAQYQDRFQPSPELPAPRWSLAVAGVCHEDEAEARRIADDRQQEVTPTLVGTPEQCREGVESLRERYRTREIVFLDLSERYEQRVSSYRLLAEALGIQSEETVPLPATVAD